MRQGADCPEGTGAGGNPAPDFAHETRAYRGGRRCVAGVDEVGRGPLAGPVTAAAVCLDPARIPPGLDDSKRLSPKRRAALYEALHEVAEISVVHVGVAEIARLNIFHAAHLAMCLAVEGLARRPDWAIIDGKHFPRALPCAGETVVGGDARVASVAAASIIAKVERDRLMTRLAADYPGYGWETNAGYPTRAHVAALAALGVTPHHRVTFAPVHNILCGHISVKS